MPLKTFNAHRTIVTSPLIISPCHFRVIFGTAFFTHDYVFCFVAQHFIHSFIPYSRIWVLRLITTLTTLLITITLVRVFHLISRGDPVILFCIPHLSFLHWIAIACA